MIIFKVILVLVLLSAAIRMASAYLNSIEASQPVEYIENSTSNIDSWRWRQPDPEADLSLEVKNGREVSSLRVRQRWTPGEWMAHGLGYFFIGIAWFVSISLFVSDPGIALFGFVFAFEIGWACLRAGDRVLQIDLYGDRVAFVTQHPLFQRQIQTYKRHFQLKFAGRVQSILASEIGQTQLDYRITVDRTGGKKNDTKTFYLACNALQGAWIFEGLRHWETLLPSLDEEKG